MGEQVMGNDKKKVGKVFERTETTGNLECLCRIWSTFTRRQSFWYDILI